MPMINDENAPPPMASTSEQAAAPVPAPAKKTKSKKTNTNTKTTKTKSKKVAGTTVENEKGEMKTHKLSLKGSAKLVSEFFEYALHSLLFQRGVYPADDFSPIKKYGLNMLLSTDADVKAYIKQIMHQLSRWMLKGEVKKLVVVVRERDEEVDLERWEFDVSVLGGGKSSKKAEKVEQPVMSELPSENGASKEPAAPQQDAKPAASTIKTEKEIQEEIRSLFRQITASVTFLPMLNGRCTFNVLVYADGDCEVPVEWEDSESREIEGAERVRLRSWGTDSHRVEAAVSYRLVE